MSKSAAHPLLELLAWVQRDLTGAKARLAEVERQIAALDLADPATHDCGCGLSFRSAEKLAEHRYLSHDGPEPEHWIAAAKLADEEQPVEPVESEFRMPEAA